MSAVTPEIAADFLIEAQEILDRLGEQLVTLEQDPSDSEQLNAVFRGFHTLKGGARKPRVYCAYSPSGPRFQRRPSFGVSWSLSSDTGTTPGLSSDHSASGRARRR